MFGTKPVTSRSPGGIANKSRLLHCRGLGKLLIYDMAKEIQCDSCQNSATVHLTQIINGKVHKVDLCETCAQKLGVTDPNGFSAAEDLLSKNFLEEGVLEEGAVCDHCGYNRINLKKTGRLGCPECYEAFASVISPMFKSMHRGEQHVGKVPHVALERREYLDQLTELENELRGAIESENYERAAEIRDSIKELKDGATKDDSSTVNDS